MQMKGLLFPLGLAKGWKERHGCNSVLPHYRSFLSPEGGRIEIRWVFRYTWNHPFSHYLTQHSGLVMCEHHVLGELNLPDNMSPWTPRIYHIY